MRLKMLSWMFICAALGLPGLAHAQLGEIAERVRELEKAMAGDVGFMVEENTYKPEAIRPYLIWPLEWEQRKLELRQMVLEEAIGELEAELKKSQDFLEQAEGALVEQGIEDREGLVELLSQRRNLEQEVTSLIAQREAAMKAVKIELAAAEAQLNALEVDLVSHRQVAEKLEEQAARLLEMYKKGRVPQHEVAEVEMRRLEQEAAMQQARAKVQTAESEIELLKLQGFEQVDREVQIATQRLEKLNAIDAGKVRQLLSQRARAEFESQLSRDRLAKLKDQQADVELQIAFLRRVLAEYEQLAPAEKSPKKGDSQ